MRRHDYSSTTRSSIGLSHQCLNEITYCFITTRQSRLFSSISALDSELQASSNKNFNLSALVNVKLYKPLEPWLMSPGENTRETEAVVRAKMASRGRLEVVVCSQFAFPVKAFIMRLTSALTRTRHGLQFHRHALAQR